MYIQYMKRMKKRLDMLQLKFNRSSFRAKDPVQFIYNYPTKADREIVGFISAMLAYGRVEQILKSVSKVLSPLGKHPSEYVKNRKNSFEKHYTDFKHRLNKGTDIVLLLYALSSVLELYGSLENFFFRCRTDAPDLRMAVTAFIEKLKEEVRSASKTKKIPLGYSLHLLPSPKDFGASKRFNLFLKWMVRKDNIDPGTWSSRLGWMKKEIIIPLDIHIAKHARKNRMTRRKSNDWKTALEITECLKKFDSEDPLKYDFAICHLGMEKSRSRLGAKNVRQ